MSRVSVQDLPFSWFRNFAARPLSARNLLTKSVMVQPMFAMLLSFTFSNVGVTGVIWIVHNAHCWHLDRVRAGQFLLFERSHARLTTAAVVPLMLVELEASLARSVRPLGLQ